MNKAIEKLESAKRKYELEKNSKNEKFEKIICEICFSSDVKLKSYYSKREKIDLYQKDIDFSKLEKDYYILYEQKNPNYYRIQKISKNIGVELLITQMYILVPKSAQGEILCLFVKRDAGFEYALEMQEKGKIVYRCTPQKYYEKEVKISVSEFDFAEKINCTLQEKIYMKSYIYTMLKDDYVEAIKADIAKYHFNKTFIFEITSNDNFKKYIKEPTRYCQKRFDFLLASVLQSKYYELDSLKSEVKIQSDIGTYEVKIVSQSINKKVKACILKETGEFWGYIYLEVPILMISAKIYESEVLLFEKKLGIREENIFKGKLSKYIDVENIYVTT